MTKLLGVIGDPIAHSLSPLIHNGWFRDMGFNATYEAMHVPGGQFAEAISALEGREILGVNVTLPHKHAALAAAAEASDAAVKIGAANTLTFNGYGGWHADNTDAPGFMTALGDPSLDKDKILILGAGGSARALVYALVNAGYSITVLNRTVEKARALIGELGDSISAYGSINQYKEHIENATIVINTTSMGYSRDHFYLPAGDGRTFFDISYGKTAEAQIIHAEQKGWTVKDGLTMLVAQAAFSFEIWFGKRPDFDSGLRRCRSALRAVS